MNATAGTSESFSKEERDAMKERAKELKAEAKRKATRADGERDLLEKIAEMPPADRKIAERVHAVVTENAPELDPKTWYGQPAWARDGKVICFFQSSAKFGTRYCTLGFSEDANLDDGVMWATSFGILSLSAGEEKTIAALVRKAVG